MKFFRIVKFSSPISKNGPKIFNLGKFCFERANMFFIVLSNVHYCLIQLNIEIHVVKITFSETTNTPDFFKAIDFTKAFLRMRIKLKKKTESNLQLTIIKLCKYSIIKT